MATRKTSTKTKKAGVKKAPAKKAPVKKAGVKKAPPKKTAAKKAPQTKKATVKAAPDPMGCCTWTDSAGQIVRRDMRKSQCTFSGAVFVPDVSCI